MKFDREGLELLEDLSALVGTFGTILIEAQTMQGKEELNRALAYSAGKLKEVEQLITAEGLDMMERRLKAIDRLDKAVNPQKLT